MAKEMKKILLVSPVPPPNGGIATWTKQYIEYFEKLENYHVDLVNTAIQGKRMMTNKRNLRDEYNRYATVKNEIISHLDKSKYEVIHYNSSCTLFGLIKDYFTLKKIRKEKIIYHCRCDLNNYVKNPLSIHLLKKISNFAYKIFVLNSQSKVFVKEHTKVKVAYIPNYIDCNNITNIPNHDYSNVKTFIYTGRISIEKGCDAILKIAPYFPDWNFKMIGDSNCDLDISKYSSNIELLGVMEHSKLLEELKKTAVFLFLSRTEGFSNSLVEAMLCGLPVVTTDVGANRDMIEDKGGIIINPDYIEKSVDIIKTYVEKTELLKKSSLFNIEKVKNKYDIHAVMNIILDEYNILG